MANEDAYVTLRGAAEAVLEEKKSVFIGNAARVETEEEAVRFLESIRQKYPDARHHVYAYLLRDGFAIRYSDDHEPQGTGGLPVLSVLQKRAIINAILVVTRYFGGILLGTGGLSRAYTQAAQLALDKAGVATHIRMATCFFSCSYPDYQKILPYLQGQRGQIRDTDFADRVTLRVEVVAEEKDAICEKIRDLTCGRAEEKDGKVFFGLL